MLKILFRILITLSCVILLVFCCFAPVSAAESETTSTSYQITFDMQRPELETNVAYLFGNDYATLTQRLDDTWFAELSSGSYQFVERDINENQYYEYAAYQYDGDSSGMDVQARPFGVFSYSFTTDRITLPFLGSIYTKAILNDLYLQYYGVNCNVDFVRFSLRNLNDDYVSTTSITTSSFGTTLASTQSSVQSDGTYVFKYYDPLKILSNIRFGRDDANTAPPLQYCFCIDFFFRPLDLTSSPNNVAIGINTNSYFSIFNFIYTTGPDLPQSWPQLDDDYYASPETDVYDDYSKVENSLIEQGVFDPDAALSVYSGLNDAFSLDFVKLTVPLQRISTILTRFTDNIPFLQFLINASLVLGLFSFILGLGRSIVGALESRRSEALHPINDKVSKGRRSFSISKNRKS